MCNLSLGQCSWEQIIQKTLGSNFQGDIVRGQLSLGYFSESNHPGGNYPVGNYPGANFSRAHLSGGNFPRKQLSGYRFDWVFVYKEVRCANKTEIKDGMQYANRKPSLPVDVIMCTLEDLVNVVHFSSLLDAYLYEATSITIIIL